MPQVHMIGKDHIEYGIGETLFHEKHFLPFLINLLLLLDLTHINIKELGISLIILHRLLGQLSQRWFFGDLLIFHVIL